MGPVQIESQFRTAGRRIQLVEAKMTWKIKANKYNLRKLENPHITHTSQPPLNITLKVAWALIRVHLWVSFAQTTIDEVTTGN